MSTNKKSGKKSQAFTIYEGFRDPVSAAVQYGFTPRKHVTTQEQDKKLAEQIDKKETHEADVDLRHVDLDTKEKISLLREAHEEGAQGGQPYMNYFEKSLKHSLLCHFDIIGNNKGVAEGIVIAAGIALLKEAGVKDPTVSINCVGDRDSSQRFVRALTEYYKKYLNELPLACKALFKKDVFSILSCTHERCKALAEEAPKSMNFLSELSRLHFKEVLEYLDASGINYILDDTLLPTKSYTAQTIFTLHDNASKKPIIYGFGARYNTLAKRIGMKRELSAVGITVAIDEKTLTSKTERKLEKPRFFLIHVGTEARFKSLAIVEMLREAGINLAHAVIKDKLSNQLMQAESMNIPYTLLMGQKECVEHSIILRNNTNRSQNTVKLTDLIACIKKIK